MATENKILYQTLEDRDNPDEIEKSLGSVRAIILGYLYPISSLVGQNRIQGKLCHWKNVLSI